MRWDADTLAAFDAALNEANVLGVSLEPTGAWCDLLLHVLALPETGPLERDARRILRLTFPAEVKIMLRAWQQAGNGPVVPLADLDEVENFFASLTWADAMYGWRFLDAPELADDWPAQPGLDLTVRDGAGSHSLYWFSECGRNLGDSPAGYCIEGLVTFEDLQVFRADESPQPLDAAIADADRYWHALHAGDSRLRVEAQRSAQAGTPSWRPYVRNAVMVSGSAMSASEEPDSGRQN